MNTRKITAILLAALILCTSLPTVAFAAEFPFTDVPANEWYYDDVRLAYERGIINGKDADTFAPNDYLKYSEAVKLAACMHIDYYGSEPLRSSGSNWYQVYVDYCYNNGIITRKNYDWNAYATRGEYMEIFSRALPKEALRQINRVDDGAIPDVPVTHKNAEGIYTLYRAGIVQGVDKTYRCMPGANVKRSEVAAILTRMMYDYQRLMFVVKLADDPADREDRFDRDEPDDNDYEDNRNDDPYENYPGDDNPNDVPVTPPETNDRYDEPVDYEDFVIANTEIGPLYFPGQYESYIRTQNVSESNGTSIEVWFTANSGNEKIFTLHIGTRKTVGYLVGYVNGIEIRIELFDFVASGWSLDDLAKANGAQEEVNYIVEQIRSMRDFSQTNNSANEDDGIYVLADTSIGEIYISNKWKSNIYTETARVNNGTEISVYVNTESGNAMVFAIRIGTGDVSERLIGYVNGIDVSIEQFEFSYNYWSDEDQEIARGVQEEANTIIEQIQNMRGYSEDNDSTSGDYVLIYSSIGNLYYPGKWRAYTETEEVAVGQGSATAVYVNTPSGRAKLYTIYFGTNREAVDLIGYVNGVDIRIEFEEFYGRGWSDEDQGIARGVQEEANTIIEQIRGMSGFSEGDANVGGEYVIMSTSIGDLYYPDKWQAYTSTKNVSVSRGSATAVYANTSSGSAKLYTLYIGTGNSADLIGYVDGVDVRIELDEASIDRWSDDDKEIARGVQEEANYIMEQIRNMRGFSEDNANAGGDYVLMSTPIGNLYYPGKWQAYTSTKNVSVSRGSAIAVYVNTPSGSAKLYTLYFGTENENADLLGTWNGIDIRLEVSDFYGNGWAEADAEIARGVQEDMNYILEQIFELDGFVE